jgi:hypothetical protein
MEIRALTGFDKSTRERYGRSYTPLNGTCNAGLGSFATLEDSIVQFNNGKMLEEKLAMYDVKPKSDETNATAASKPIKKFKTPLLVAGGLLAAYLIYKKFK